MECVLFEHTIASEEDQVGPGDLAAILLLDGPQKATSLVKRSVVGPAVERSETLLSATEVMKSVDGHSMKILHCVLPSTTTAILDTVSASAVPCHADKQATIVTEVGRPVVLAVGLREDVSQRSTLEISNVLLLPARP